MWMWFFARACLAFSYFLLVFLRFLIQLVVVGVKIDRSWQIITILFWKESGVLDEDLLKMRGSSEAGKEYTSPFSCYNISTLSDLISLITRPHS